MKKALIQIFLLAVCFSFAEAQNQVYHFEHLILTQQKDGRTHIRNREIWLTRYYARVETDKQAFIYNFAQNKYFFLDKKSKTFFEDTLRSSDTPSFDPAKVQIKRLNQVKYTGKYKAEKYQVLFPGKEGQVRENLWISRNTTIHPRFYNKLITNSPLYLGFYAATLKHKGIPTLHERYYPGGKMVNIELRNVEKIKIQTSLFRVPYDYKQVEKTGD